MFSVTVNGVSKTITVTKDSTKFNAQFSQLATQLNAAIAALITMQNGIPANRDVVLDCITLSIKVTS